MPDDMATVNDASAVACMALHQARGAVAPANRPTAVPHADSVTLGEGAAASCWPTEPATAPARCRTDRHAEAIQQATQLASWEDEGGTTSG